MRNLPVHWSEGMFLRPQHFQAADRYWTELVQTSEHFDHPYNYGVRSIEISKDAIANYQVQVTVCHARMKDGTVIMLETGQEPDRLDFKEDVQTLQTAMEALPEAFESQTNVRVFLAVPKVKMGRQNVGRGTAGPDQRFVEAVLSVQDESVGGNDQDIQHRTLNVRLMLSTQDVAGYELLPVAQFKRVGDQEATPQLDRDYIPPLLSIDAWPELGRDIIRKIYDIIGNKIEVLSEAVVNRGISLATSEPGDAEQVHMLHELNEAYARLGCLTFASGVHPFTAYTELCRILGMLSIFTKARRVPEDIPHYDHDNLAYIFQWVYRKIEDIVHAVSETTYERRDFIGAGTSKMHVSLEPRWFSAGWSWYVGVSPGNITERECRELLSAGNLDWKLGASDEVDSMFVRRMPGLTLLPLPQAPRVLPGRGGWLFFEVGRGNAAWQKVQATQSLAMRLKEALIRNPETLQGQKRLEVNVRGKVAVLQFALFAVPSHS